MAHVSNESGGTRVSIICILYVVYFVYCLLYIVHFILYIVYWISYIVYCILYIVYCILYIVYCILYIVYRILYVHTSTRVHTEYGLERDPCRWMPTTTDTGLKVAL